MFTGIVSAVSKVVSAERGRIGIDHAGIARHLEVGGSVAVNGCCLTVVKKRGPVFYADMVPETLRRTNLGALRVGMEVNLELPVSAGSLLDGHLVGGMWTRPRWSGRCPPPLPARRSHSSCPP